MSRALPTRRSGAGCNPKRIGEKFNKRLSGNTDPLRGSTGGCGGSWRSPGPRPQSLACGIVKFSDTKKVWNDAPGEADTAIGSWMQRETDRRKDQQAPDGQRRSATRVDRRLRRIVEDTGSRGYRIWPAAL
jgi:hypothetical protein